MHDSDLQLSDRQRQVLAALRRLHERDGFAPSLRELAAEVGLASTSSVHRHVRVLERHGMIERRANTARAVTTVAR